MAMTNCGTPLLMAPEVLDGNLYNHKADVWSLGCLFFELVTGFPPFTGNNIPHLRDNLKKGIYNIPKTIKLSLQSVSFINSCLQYDYNTRISWQELIDHPFIAANFGGSGDDLCLSYIEN